MTPSPWWDKARHRDRRGFLATRAAIARAVREWFWDQGFTEVEPQALSPSPGAEVHVDAFASSNRYLHTSPEFAMKKLLAAGEEKIFYFGKCWRKGETGPLHAEEFTMLEWYRANEPYERVMDDCVELARLAATIAHSEMLHWKDKSCDPFAAAGRLTVSDAFARFLPSSLAEEGTGDAFSAAIVQIEPHLGTLALTVLHEYPIEEAALARRCAHDPRVAERFEMYACGVELANGFGELTDPVEQRARLIAAMDEKEKRYGMRWPIDEDFLAALAHMPPASGVALGFDRLVMLATGARHIGDVLWTPP
jgi:lysyl-tRNA synthetase class 2